MTIEYQRAQAKDLVRYFKEQKEATIAEKAQCAPAPVLYAAQLASRDQDVRLNAL